MTSVFKEICEKNNLRVFRQDGTEKTFEEVMEQIYFEWSLREFKDFMRDIQDADINKLGVFYEVNKYIQ